ncbi:MAG: ABC transporter substrate-binding protein [Methanospirillum sp.]|uniref:ABC transporter substrate-binding protein n=1 Tax=Methanospirillum sp. TaxID=45200 RepID=UPI00236AC009|nr:ABC transporter substrate-binding protein [Methanospirillum sp.]MDD1729794.1 ABC transporter substrate-binding protein [Methanospirillum sp.]
MTYIIIALCLFSGCVDEKTPVQSPAQNITEPLKTDVVIPVNSPSDLVSSNVMTKKNGVPAGGLIYEGLLTKNRNGVYEPGLAESWDVSDDAKTWTFHLVHNATWHDGVPVTSADVKFTNDFLKSNNLTMGFVLSDVSSVTCPDDYTVVFNLKNAYSVWPDRLAQSPGIGVYPKHIFEKIQDPKTYKDTQFIGTGPFKFDKSESGYFRVSKNDKYRGEDPKISGVILKLITNQDSQILALKNGEIDIVSDITPAVADSLRNEPNIGVITIPATTGYELGFTMIQYPTNLSSFRHAMSHTIDRDTICTVLGNARPTNTTFLMPEVAGAYVNPNDTGMYDYNLSKAREELKQAGFIQDGQGILRGPDGNPVELFLPIGGKASTGVSEKIVTALRNDWATLGIQIKTTKYDDESQYRKAIDKGNLFIDGMPSILHDDPDDLVDFAVTPLQEKNYYNFNNSEFNALTVKVRNTVNKEERKGIGYQMQDILADNVPTVPICSTDSYDAFRTDRFTGWEKLVNYTSIQDRKVLTSLQPVSRS